MEIVNLEVNNLISNITLHKGPKMGNGFIRKLLDDIDWDEQIKSRKTASFGIPYNYSGIFYEHSSMPFLFQALIDFVKKKIHFTPNSCLLNFYLNSQAKMGFHSDNIEVLDSDSGIAIFSFGEMRTLTFELKNDRSIKYDVCLKNESFFYMTQEVQRDWVHAVLPYKSDTSSERISITFRKLKKT